MDYMNQCTDFYLSYLHERGINLEANNFDPQVESMIGLTDFSNPQSALELNNFAIITLIETEKESDLSTKTMGINLAIEALEKGIETETNFLCQAHLALVYLLLGERRLSTQMAFSGFLEALEVVNNKAEFLPGLVYLPAKIGNLKLAAGEYLETALKSADSLNQALMLFTVVLYQSQLAFYTGTGLRFLHLARQTIPNSAALWLQLGIAQLVNSQGEGLFSLQKAQEILPHYAPTHQALSLAYRELQRQDLAQFWREKTPTAHLSGDFAYLDFDEKMLLAVEPSLKSYVTSVLLAQGDWFEAEMEFWRSQIQPGMTVIDVGANVGVYTFSAAQRVGNRGKVLAVEPFSGCIRCLEQTCQINQLDWVKICAGAASNQLGSAYLSLQGANELNEIVSSESAAGKLEKVACFTLDSLLDLHHLTQVDWLKIDAEGHEMQVLEGANRLLADFKPGIIYENIAGSQGDNFPVAQFLTDKGYNLFRYRPYLQELIPLDSIDDLQGNLNIIALPKDEL